MKKYLVMIFVLTIPILGCSKINKIAGNYDLEAGAAVCLVLDLKTVELDESSITVKGGGRTSFLDALASMSKAPSDTVAQARINNSKHSQGITTKFANVKVSDVSIKMSEWDKKSLTPAKVLFTKQFALTLENGKKTNLYADEKERLGIEYYKECIFRK